MSRKIHVFDVLYNLRNSARFPKMLGTLDFKIFPGGARTRTPRRYQKNMKFSYATAGQVSNLEEHIFINETN